jgi:hypothetical protein
MMVTSSFCAPSIRVYSHQTFGYVRGKYCHQGKLVHALIADNCDMSRGFYTRHSRDAAVTKLVARPMLHAFFPELAHFEQPLSGEVYARTQVWENLLKKDDGSGSTPEGHRCLVSN